MLYNNNINNYGVFIMSKKEQEEIQELPEKYRPMRAWAYWAWSVIYSFPIVGLIFMIINSIRSDNIARRNHARSFFYPFIIVTLLLVITVLILYFTGVFDMLFKELDKLLKMK
jgi:uncharacterized membrane protein